MTKYVADKLTELLRVNPFYEICGLITDNGDVIEIANVAKHKANNYVFDTLSYYSELRELKRLNIKVVATWHSHPHCNSEPSTLDIEYFLKSEYDMVIVSFDGVRELKHA